MSTRHASTEGRHETGVPEPEAGLAGRAVGAVPRERLAAYRLHADLTREDDPARDVDAIPRWLRVTMDANERYHALHPESVQAPQRAPEPRHPGHGYAVAEDGDAGLRVDRTF